VAHEITQAPKLIGLPLSVVSPVDVGRLIRELEAVDNTVLEQNLRGQSPALPQLTRMMANTVEFNHLNLLDETDRKQLNQLLVTVREKAPVLHISFSAELTPLFTESIMAWMRREIHPVVLMTAGLQPNIGAGCIVRSTNKYFDLSLRQNFIDKRSLLMEQLRQKDPVS
jgi:F0F1-type ATP synthase delta subunit